MPYTPNPTDSTQPTEDKFAESAAAEFRALKSYIQTTLLGRVLRLQNGQTFTTEMDKEAFKGAVIGLDPASGEPVPVTLSSGTAVALAAALVASSGSTLVGWIHTLLGSSYRTVSARLRDWNSAKDGGAVGDFSADDTAALQAIIDNALFKAGSPATVADTGLVIDIPRGIYKITGSGLQITNKSVTDNGYNNGIVLRGPFAVLKGDADCTNVLTITTPSTAENVSGIRLEGLSIDCSLMGATATGLLLENTYNDILRDVTVFGGAAGIKHVHFNKTGSNTQVYGLICGPVHVTGEDFGVAQLVWTTLNFCACSWTQITISKAWGLGFFGCIAQNPSPAAFVLSDCRGLTILGGDFEGTSGYIFDASTPGVYGVSNVYMRNAEIASIPNFINGVISNLDVDNKFNNARVVQGTKGYVPGIAAVATEIYNFDGDPVTGGNSRTIGEIKVYGSSGGANAFIDRLWLAEGVLTVLSSTTHFGAPSARTYTMAGTDNTSLRLAMAAGTYQAKVLAQSSPFF